mmetsp:Transcript_14399/g.17450  ORF Transcript_14399/g.17450 Transcript_14399/m.17450 type:complete len:118 (+) Transcript_14399:99-452(+)
MAPPGPVVDFWNQPDRAGWLQKQGKFIKTWRRRYCVMKDGKIFWFKTDKLDSTSQTRGIIDISQCLSVRGAEEVLNKPFTFEISVGQKTEYFIADTEKEKEDWISAIGSTIVRLSSR